MADTYIYSLISLVVLISVLPHLTVICITFSEIPGESPLQMENRGVILSEMRQSVAHNPLPPTLLTINISLGDWAVHHRSSGGVVK